jgi:hypothetical protein
VIWSQLVATFILRDELLAGSNFLLLHEKGMRRVQIAPEDIAARLRVAAKDAEKALRPPAPPERRSRPDASKIRERACGRCRVAVSNLFKGIEGESLYIHAVIYGLGYLNVVTVGHQSRGGDGSRWDPAFVYLQRTIEIYLDEAAPLVRIPECDRTFGTSARFEKYLIEELLPEIANALASCRVAHNPTVDKEVPDKATSSVASLLQCVEYEARIILDAVANEPAVANGLRMAVDNLAELRKGCTINASLEDYPSLPGWVSYRARTDYLDLVLEKLEEFLSCPQAQDLSGSGLLLEKLRRRYYLGQIASQFSRVTVACPTAVTR